MTVDVTVVGAPFLDLTFEGLPRVPGIGEEVVAQALHVAPGGTGMQAVGAARLGLTAALVAPIGGGGLAGLMREILESERVRLVGSAPASGHDGNVIEPRAARGGVPITALLTTRDGVAMATVLDGAEPSREDVAGMPSRAAVMSLGRLSLAPPEAAIYVVTGGLEVGGVDEATLHRLHSAKALILNAAEATVLTSRTDPEEAARDLGSHVPTVVVTLGVDGAVAVEGEDVTRVPAPEVDVVDATGAGDLFVAAYVWADLHGAPLSDRLAWASLYAALSVRARTAFEGAVDLQELLAEGRSRELRPPADLP